MHFNGLSLIAEGVSSIELFSSGTVTKFMFLDFETLANTGINFLFT